MCGITGIYKFNKNESIDDDLLKKMNNTLYHRGPDGEGYYVCQEAGVWFWSQKTEHYRFDQWEPAHAQ